MTKMQHFFPGFGLWEPWEALAGRLGYMAFGFSVLPFLRFIANIGSWVSVLPFILTWVHVYWVSVLPFSVAQGCMGFWLPCSSLHDFM